MKSIEGICNYIERWLACRNANNYIAYLQKKGVKIGSNFKIIGGFLDKNIDLTRPSLITIGNNVTINKNFKLMTHDFVCGVFINKGYDFIPSSGRVVIGNNVRFGMDCTVLKGVTIGDNCFIGANSLVCKDIPANSIAVGSPCKTIMTIDEYYQKRIPLFEEEAFDYARSIQERFNRKPIPKDFMEEFVLFVSGNEIDKYPEIPIKKQLGPIYDRYKSEHIAKFKSFNDFLRAAGL